MTYSSRVRVLSYFLPSMIGSVLLNIPKFLEATLVPMTVVNHEDNVSTEIIIYNVTSLRLDPDYMYYYIHWTRSEIEIYIYLRLEIYIFRDIYFPLFPPFSNNIMVILKLVRSIKKICCKRKISNDNLKF